MNPSRTGAAPLFLGAALFLVYACLGLWTASHVGQPSFHWKHDWVPSLGMNLEFYLGDFQRWFMALILIISGAVQLYTTSYFAGKPKLLPLIGYLQVFTAAMLGVVASNNLFLMFLFWETTSLCSFLMVGLDHESAENRRKAGQGLMITMFGGLGLLLGAIFLWQSHGTVSVSELRAMTWEPGLLDHVAMCCILMACITKSAQFPFHFWLPNAMAGPTPVSALLHSATMVKAGVYLMAMLAPLFSQSSLWASFLLPAGIATILISNVMGIKADDLKTLFASTTLSALGVLTVLAGIGDAYALKAFVIFLTAHALYKAPLFLATGVIESSLGSRDLQQVRGAARKMPLLGAFLTLSFLSLLGLPPMLGFLGKEYTLKAAWAYSQSLTIGLVLALAGAIAVGARALFYLWKPSDAELKVKPAAMAKLIAVGTPVFVSVALVLAYPLAAQPLQLAASSLMLSDTSSYKFWEGFSPALILSIITLVAAAALFPVYRGVSRQLHAFADGLYEKCIGGLMAAAKTAGYYFGPGRLDRQLTLMLMVIVTVTMLEFLNTLPDLEATPSPGELSIFSILLPIIMVAAVFSAVTKSVIHTLITLGTIGVLMAVIYLWCSAPDLALTQLLAEVLILFLLIGVILKKQKFTSQKFSLPRLLVAGGMGLMSTLLVLKAQTLEWGKEASLYYLQNSYSGGFGKNVVNVILVDFRALDTLGELTVLAIAALGVTATFGAVSKRLPMPPLTSTPWMLQLFRLLVVMVIPLTLITLYRGHNDPGGGFIAALLASIFIGFGLMVGYHRLGAQELRSLSHKAIVLGLSLALVHVFAPLLVGKTMMQGLWLHIGDFHIGTPLIFDIGVFILVVGFVTQYLRHFVQPFSPNQP